MGIDNYEHWTDYLALVLQIITVLCLMGVIILRGMK